MPAARAVSASSTSASTAFSSNQSNSCRASQRPRSVLSTQALARPLTFVGDERALCRAKTEGIGDRGGKLTVRRADGCAPAFDLGLEFRPRAVAVLLRHRRLRVRQRRAGPDGPQVLEEILGLLAQVVKAGGIGQRPHVSPRLSPAHGRIEGNGQTLRVRQIATPRHPRRSTSRSWRRRPLGSPLSDACAPAMPVPSRVVHLHV